MWKRVKLKVYYQIRDGCVLILPTQSPILHFPLKSLRESPYERQDPRTRWSNVPVHHYTKYLLLLLKKNPSGIALFLVILILYMKLQIFFISVPMTCEQWLLRGKATHLLWCLESGPQPQCENKEWDRSLKHLQIPSGYTLKMNNSSFSSVVQKASMMGPWAPKVITPAFRPIQWHHNHNKAGTKELVWFYFYLSEILSSLTTIYWLLKHA